MKLIRHIEEEELEWSHHHRRKGNIDNIENMKMKFYPYQTSNPCYIWNHLAKEAYDVEKADYFYQLNSNSFLLSSCTLTKLTSILLKKTQNTIIVKQTDTNNLKLINNGITCDRRFFNLFRY